MTTLTQTALSGRKRMHWGQADCGRDPALHLVSLDLPGHISSPVMRQSTSHPGYGMQGAGRKTRCAQGSAWSILLSPGLCIPVPIPRRELGI